MRIVGVAGGYLLVLIGSINLVLLFANFLLGKFEPHTIVRLFELYYDMVLMVLLLPVGVLLIRKMRTGDLPGNPGTVGTRNE